MSLGTEALLSVEEQAQECRFKEEREHAFHDKRLADHATGDASEL